MNHKKRLSSSSKKSSQLLASSFHSTVHRHITSSSSSSTNTNLTNIHHRQILFKVESKYHPSVNNSLCEIPFTNIRFLQEIGEGKRKKEFISVFI